MRTTQTKKTEITKKFKISVSSIYPLSPTRVVLALTTFEKKGGET